MKFHVIFLLSSALVISGCLTTSQTTKDVASTVIETAGTLHTQHVKTIDAYIASLEAAKSDTSKLIQIITDDQADAQNLKSEILKLRTDVLVGEAILMYQTKVQSKVFNGLNQRIEDEHWPSITAKHEVYRAKADALGAEVKNHHCATDQEGCNTIAFADFQKKSKEYRDYSVVAEYILHLGYERETEIWQQAVELFEAQNSEVQIKATALANTQDNQLNISAKPLLQELQKVELKFQSTIEQLIEDKALIEKHWQGTKKSLNFLKNDLSKPAIWKLILNGASEQAKAVLTGYSGTINQAVSGVFGKQFGSILSTSFEDQVERIVDVSIGNISSAIGETIDDAQTKLNNEVDKFIAAKNMNVSL